MPDSPPIGTPGYDSPQTVRHESGGETVEANAFIGKATKPTEEELATALGSAKAVWDRFIAELAGDNGVDVQEWSSYSRKAGWSLRLKRKKRTIVWLAPCQGCFRVAFILGDKAMKAARGCALPATRGQDSRRSAQVPGRDWRADRRERGQGHCGVEEAGGD